MSGTELETHVESPRSDFAAIGADLADINANLDLMTERVALLPGKGFWIAVTGIEVALLSGLILFADELKDLVGV